MPRIAPFTSERTDNSRSAAGASGLSRNSVWSSRVVLIMCLSASLRIITVLIVQLIRRDGNLFPGAILRNDRSDLPAGCAAQGAVKPLSQKYFAFQKFGFAVYARYPASSMRGVSRSSRNARRNAVDVKVLSDVRHRHGR